MALDKFRSASKSKFFKLFLMLIVASFAVWGIGDIFKGGSSYVAEIGDRKVSMQEFSQARSKEIARLREVFGSAPTEEQLASMRVNDLTLKKIITAELIDSEINDLNIIVSDEVAVRYIKGDPAFRNESGEFDFNLFKNILAYNDIVEEEYINRLKKKNASKYVSDTLVEQQLKNPYIAGYIYQFIGEKREVEVLTIGADKINVNPVSDSEAKKFYNNHKTDYFTPEYRNGSYIILELNKLMKVIELSDEEVKEEYNRNTELFAEPEYRDIYNLVFNKKEEADEAFAALIESDDFSKMASKLTGNKIEELLINNVDKASLPIEIQDKVFSLKPNEISEPSKSGLGWHIFRLEKITLPKSTEFAEASKQIIKDLKTQKAEKLLYDYSQNIEDEFASGTTMEEVAKKFPVSFHAIPLIDKDGVLESRKKVSSLPKFDNFLEVLFSTDLKEESPLTSTPEDNGYFVIRVDEIHQPYVESFDIVENIIKTKILAKKRQEDAKKLVLNVHSALLKGKSFKNVVSDKKTSDISFSIKEVVTFERPSIFAPTSSKYPVAFVSNIFNSKLGTISNYYQDNKSNFYIAKVNMIIAADNSDKNTIAQIQDELEDMSSNIIYDSYMAYLYRKFPVRVTAKGL